MPELQVPLSIWLSATPSERDGFYISAGFDPNLPVVDNGTDNNFVRFRQGAGGDSAAEAEITATIESHGLSAHAAGIHVNEPAHLHPQAGDDLRDFQLVSTVGPVAPGTTTDEFGTPIAGTGIAIAGRALRLILGGGGGRLTAAIWNSLPSLVRTALTQVGIGVGALIAFNGDIPFITLPGQDITPAPFIGPPTTLPTVDIQIGANPLQPVQVVGSWVANGVTFYRLASGKLAVQNKKGRWKVWRPKRPIVLYADGASNLKTMLRADKALNKQAKKVAAMLNRRAPRSRKSTKSASPGIIVQGSGRVIDT